jgi:PAS domain S-box-containing protein
VEQSPSAVMIANADGVIDYVNPSFTRLTGYTREEVLGESPSLLRSRGTTTIPSF